MRHTYFERLIYIMTELKFNVVKEQRKALVRALCEIIGQDSVYHGPPNFLYSVGRYTIDKLGTIFCDSELVPDNLLIALAERGFVADNTGAPFTATASTEIPSDNETGCEFQDSDEDCKNSTTDISSIADTLSIDFPISDFTPRALDNLEKLVTSKAWIIKKMINAETLPIEQSEDRLCFTWFKPNLSSAELDAYSRLIVGLCKTAKSKKRIVAKEKPLENGDSEKFKARCFLLSLNFIGEEYAQARKTLLAPMSGSGSHKSSVEK